MTRYLFSVLLTALSFGLQSVSAQHPGFLSGTVADAGSGAPVGYATVVVLRDSAAVNAVAADAQGRFSLKVAEPGDYTLSVTMVGYTRHTEEVRIPSAGKDLGTIRLQQGIEVDDVVVAVQKPLVMSNAEKQTYSVEDDPQAATSTLEEIIRKVPQLSLDSDGNLRLNGQSDFKILVNGRNAATMSNNFKEIVRSMPASQISRIEVITNPSTKYEAEGVGGIINFITQRKREMHGYSGNVSTGIDVLENPAYFGNATLSLQSGKFAAQAMGYANYWDTGRVPSEQQSWQENFDSDNRYNLTSGSQSANGTNVGVNLDMSYQPDTLNLVTLSGWLWTGRSRSNSSSASTVEDTEHRPILQFGDSGISRWFYTGGSVALNYEHTFGKEGHTLTLSDEVEIDPDRGRTIHLYEEDYDYTNRQNEDNRTVSNTVQIDYVNPLSEHHNIEAGLKHIYRNNRTSLHATEELPSGEETLQFTDMHYRQHIMGIYAGYGFNFVKWSGRLGARMERTWNDADVHDTEHGRYSFSNRQFNPVPYASLTFIPAPTHNLSIAYTQRLQRPHLSMLSPAEDVTSPLQVSYGNPDLKATVYHTLSLQYGHYAAKWSMTLALKTFLSNNNMSAYSFSNSEGVLISTYSNDVRTRSYGFSGSVSYRPCEKFNLSLSYTGDYAKYDFAAMRIHNSDFSFGENLNLDIAVWKGGRVLLGESYNTGRSALGTRTQHFYYYYVGLKQQFFNKKLDASINVSNPFNKYTEFSSRNDTPTYRGWNTSRNAFRRVSFRLVWRFGKENVRVKQAARTISNDDIAGGSKQGGGEKQP